jgi:Fe-S oxidoreductase
MRRIAATAGLPRAMRLPRLARRHLRERHADLTRDRRVETPPDGARVAYFHGCAANYLDDGVGDAVIAVLRQHGVEPALPPQRCSGTPIQTYGQTRLVLEAARFNLASLASFDKVVTGCASCTLTLKDYPQLFEEGPEREGARRLAAKVRHITEFVAESPHGPSYRPAVSKQKVTYHSSCHLRAAGVTKQPRQVLSRLPGVDFVEMQDADRCAGGAGTYILKDYDTSQKIFERKRQAIRDSGAAVVATSCPACMIQLNNGLDGAVRVKHVAELLRDAAESPAPVSES